MTKEEGIEMVDKLYKLIKESKNYNIWFDLHWDDEREEYSFAFKDAKTGEESSYWYSVEHEHCFINYEIFKFNGPQIAEDIDLIVEILKI